MKSAFLQTKSLQTLDDVGGWENRRKMGIVTAALYDPNACGLILSNEEELLFFLDHLNACDLVLGYRLIRGFVIIIKTTPSVGNEIHPGGRDHSHSTPPF